MFNRIINYIKFCWPLDFFDIFPVTWQFWFQDIITATNCNKWTLTPKWERVIKTKRCIRISNCWVGSDNINQCIMAQSFIKCGYQHFHSVISHTVLWAASALFVSFSILFSPAVACVEKLVLGKYLDIFSSLIRWAHVLLKQCVVQQLLPVSVWNRRGGWAALGTTAALTTLETLHLKQEERFPRKIA